MIGPPVARQHSRLLRLNRLRGSTTPVRLVEQNLAQSRALASETKRDDGRDTLFVAAFLLGFLLEAETGYPACLHEHVSYPTAPKQKRVENSKEEPAGM